MQKSISLVRKRKFEISPRIVRYFVQGRMCLPGRIFDKSLCPDSDILGPIERRGVPSVLGVKDFGGKVRCFSGYRELENDLVRI